MQAFHVLVNSRLNLNSGSIRKLFPWGHASTWWGLMDWAIWGARGMSASSGGCARLTCTRPSASGRFSASSMWLPRSPPPCWRAPSGSRPSPPTSRTAPPTPPSPSSAWSRLGQKCTGVYMSQGKNTEDLCKILRKKLKDTEYLRGITQKILNSVLYWKIYQLHWMLKFI